MKKWELSRRTVLRGAGATLALPLLEAMWPASARAQAAGRPKRFVAFYVACGMYMQRWTPAQTGSAYTLSPILTPLGAYDGLPSVKEDVNVITGLTNAPAEPDGPGDHASGTGAFITCAHPFKTSGSNIRNGISVDQVMANALRGQTRFASLELGVDGGGGSGDCDSGYSCAYARNIAWASNTQPLAKETEPRALFDRLFGAVDPNQSAEAVARRKRLKQSVLDAVKEDTAALKARVGKTDQAKLDEYLTGVRELERRVQSEQPSACTPSSRPGGWTDIRDKTTQMLDLIAYAFQCDLTRVATFMLQNAGSGYVYRFLNLTEGHHSLSHHGRDQAKLDQLAIIDRWEVEQFAYLLRKLKSIREPDGSTLLDHSLCFFSSEIEDGDSHAHHNMPILLGGKGGGALQTGRHVKFTGDVPVANLLLKTLNTLGVSAASFGNSTGPLSL